MAIFNKGSEPKIRRDSGSLKAWMVTTICLIIVIAGLSVFSVWLYMQYRDQKDNVDSIAATRSAAAAKKQSETDEKLIENAKNTPYSKFYGPEDYGSLYFLYPRSWSVYVAIDGSASGSTYTAYLNPGSVPPMGEKQQFALRITIEQKGYDDVLQTYDKLVKKGKLVSSSVKINGQTGTRLDGNFTDDIRGSAVLFKIRDKTLTIRTDANTFEDTFNSLIQTIKFDV